MHCKNRRTARISPDKGLFLHRISARRWRSRWGCYRQELNRGRTAEFIVWLENCGGIQSPLLDVCKGSWIMPVTKLSRICSAVIFVSLAQ
ncbi:hypothetical protein KCP69_19810 [Salmonella enterica subsp. enterica]|nr:hypothetical protein KCP69_19810 [Salmonella enterica subsp. enterica]